MMQKLKQDLVTYLNEEFDKESATSALLLVRYNDKHESGQGVAVHGKVMNDDMLEIIFTLVWKYGEKLAVKEGLKVESSNTDAAALMVGMSALIEHVDSLLGISEEEDIPEPQSEVRH